MPVDLVGSEEPPQRGGSEMTVPDAAPLVVPSLSGLGHHRTLAEVQRDFQNPQLEGRRWFAEWFGTFFLVLVAAGAPVVNAVSGGAIGLAAQVVAPGLMVMAIILFMGATSGAHLNPAVTIAFAARGDFPWRRVPGYVVAQVLGGLAAALVLAALFGRVDHLGASALGPGISELQALAVEILLTLGLVSTILGTASKAQNVGALAALAVGGYIALAGLWAAPVSGASMNPVRSIAPMIVDGNLSHAWVFLVGPVVGALLAVGVAFILRGPGGDEPAVLAAQGRLTEILGESAQRAGRPAGAGPTPNRPRGPNGGP
jgi:aquaporin Z